MYSLEHVRDSYLLTVSHIPIVLIISWHINVISLAFSIYYLPGRHGVMQTTGDLSRYLLPCEIFPIFRNNLPYWVYYACFVPSRKAKGIDCFINIIFSCARQPCLDQTSMVSFCYSLCSSLLSPPEREKFKRQKLNSENWEVREYHSAKGELSFCFPWASSNPETSAQM